MAIMLNGSVEILMIVGSLSGFYKQMEDSQLSWESQQTDGRIRGQESLWQP